MSQAHEALSEAQRRIRDALDRGYPESVRFDEPGDEIIGVLVRAEEGNTAYGTCRIAVLADEGGVEHSVWLFHTALLSQFKRLAPQTGETVGIRYLGKVQPEHGSAYENYRVVVDRLPGVARIDWGDEDEDVPAPEATTVPTDDDIPF